MAVAPLVYGRFLESCLEGRVNLIRDELWAMLVTSSYTFNQDTHKFKTVVTGEVIGSGYTAGGIKITNSGPTYDSATNMVTVPAGNLMWPIVTWPSVIGLVMYMNPSDVVESAKPLVAYIDFGGAISRTDQAFYVNWPSTGCLKLATP